MVGRLARTSKAESSIQNKREKHSIMRCIKAPSHLPKRLLLSVKKLSKGDPEQLGAASVI